MKNPARRFLWIPAAMAFLVSAAGLTAQTSDLTPITDPQVLLKMGFPADAKNVFAAPGALTPHHESTPSPNEFGTLSPGWSSESGTSGHPRQSATYTTPLGLGDIAPATGDRFYDWQLQMPSGAHYEFLRWWGNDNDAVNDLAFFAFKSCLPAFSGGAPTNVLLGTDDPATSGTPGNTSGVISVTANETVDNESCLYWGRVRWDGLGTPLSVQKMRAEWFRQVSPAPATATFGDVPTTSGQFKFVEALVAAGITAGCGGGNYCPNDPVTRGQMAVFLASALGLHWAQ